MATRATHDTIYQLWSVEQSILSSGKVARQTTSFEALNKWTRQKRDAASDRPLIWTTELALVYIRDRSFVSASNLPAVSFLLTTFGCNPLDVISLSDTVQFNTHISKRAWGQLGRLMRPRRTYSVSDNTFGICWTWDPNRRKTMGLMYGSTGEGCRQMDHVLSTIHGSHQLRKHPLLIALAVLQAETTEMQNWVSGQGRALTEAHVQTGHHAYAYIGRAHVHDFDISSLAQDVCGLAVNVTSSALCLQRIVKLGTFIVTECSSVVETLTGAPLEDARLVSCIKATNRDVISCTGVWKLRAEALLDEAEAWKHKADILVQTVFTLVTQKDQTIGIQIAKDSKLLAEKVTQDSTSMKAIAAVTMCFLPGTFVASLFAMPMFEWRVSPNDTVSGQFWIYWAVTLPLTISVICGWLVWVNYPMMKSVALRRRQQVGPGKEQP